MVLSQNGWVANDISLTTTYTIGNGRVVRLRRGDAGYLLKHYADWHDKFVEDVDQGADDWGYAERNIRGSDTTVSNHASGTALDLNATKHPLGVRGTYSAAKAKLIREHLKLYGGVIRWGGDYQIRPDEMHFEINANAAAVGRVATALRTAAAKPSAPGGTVTTTPKVAGLYAQITSLANQILVATTPGTPNHVDADRIRDLSHKHDGSK